MADCDAVSRGLLRMRAMIILYNFDGSLFWTDLAFEPLPGADVTIECRSPLGAVLYFSRLHDISIRSDDYEGVINYE